MAYPFPRTEGNQPPVTGYDGYRPSSRHDLFYDNSNPPRLDVPRPTSPFNPYAETEESRSYKDTTTPPTYPPTKFESNPFSDAKQPPYQDARSRSELTFEPLHPSQSHQDPYMKSTNSFASPYIEQGNHGPSPPPPKQRTLFSRIFNGDQRFAYFCWIISIIQIGVFVGELVRNAKAMKSPIQIKPTFNPLLGPSSYVLVNMGARFPACMHAIPGITDITQNIWPCLNNTANPSSLGPMCSLSDICGFGGFHGQPPDQWFRLIVPIFLHGGVIHILFNLLVQLRLGADMEKTIGTIRFMIIYFPSGIMGFALGANFAGNGVASTGCSGSLFGIIAVVILDLCYNWNSFEHPKRQLIIILVQVIICFGLGLLPGLDNFSHIGGFATGLLLGIAVMRAPPRIRARLDDQRSSVYELDAPYSSLTGRGASSGRQRGLVGYFKGRRGWWWIWNVIRISCLTLVIITFALLLNNFYAHGGGHCSWCRYLSCLPVNGWCDLGNIQFSNSTTTPPPRMMLF